MGIYDQYLQRIEDEAARVVAEEAFKEWDSNTTKKFQEIHDGYKPYKELIDGYEPDVLSAGVQLLEQLRDNPRTVYDNIGNHYKYTNDAGGGSNSPSGNTSTPSVDTSTATQGLPPQGIDPDKFAALEKSINELNQAFQAQQQQTVQQQELVQFNNYLDSLTGKYGDYDRDWVLGKIASGIDPEAAVKGYVEWYEKMTGRQLTPSNGNNNNNSGGSAPSNILGQGGGIANEAFDPVKMDRQQTQDFVSNYLANSLEGG
jgi:hypothetical protein